MRRIILLLIGVLLLVSCFEEQADVESDQEIVLTTEIPPETEQIAETVQTTLVATPIPTKTSMVTPTKPIEPNEIVIANATIQPTITPRSTIIPTERPTPLSISTPGPNVGILYMNNDQIHRYSIANWVSEIVATDNIGSIREATSSESGQLIAFWDDEGLKIQDTVTSESYLVSDDLHVSSPKQPVFSPDEQQLAYTDDDGLKIYDLGLSISWKVIDNDVSGLTDDPVDVQRLTVYQPTAWSPDQKWLHVWVGRWEGGWTALLPIQGKAIYYLKGCGQMDWSSSEAIMTMAVRYNGYLLCGGEEDGVYVVYPEQDGIVEQRIFSEPEETSTNALVGVDDVQWSPDSSMILFVLEDETVPEAQLRLISPDGSETQIIAEVMPGRIETPRWSADGKLVYYMERVDDYRVVYELDIETLEKRNVYMTDAPEFMISMSPDNEWLVMANNSIKGKIRLNLVHISGEVVDSFEMDRGWELLGWQMDDWD